MLRTQDLQNPELVIIDLGIAQNATTKRNVIYGTPGYIPHEVWLSKNWLPQSDMFSLGVVVMQVLLGRTGLFTDGAETFRQMEEVARCRTPAFELLPSHLPSLRWCAQSLLQKNFLARPSADSLLNEPWKTTEVTDETQFGSIDEQFQDLPTTPTPCRRPGLQRRMTSPALFPTLVSPRPAMIGPPRRPQKRQTVHAMHAQRYTPPIPEVSPATRFRSLATLPVPDAFSGCASVPLPLPGLGLVPVIGISLTAVPCF